MRYYPVYFNLQGRCAVVVGGGAVAERKVMGLLEAEAHVTVVAPDLTVQLRALAEMGRLMWIARAYQEGDLASAFLAISATDDRVVNEQVRHEAITRGIPINVVDDAPSQMATQHLNFITPAVVRRGDLAIAISTGGKAPALAARIRQQLEQVIGDEYGALTDLAGELRDSVSARHPDSGRRKELWYQLADSDVLDLLRRGDENAARRRAAEIADVPLDSKPDTLEARVGNTPLLRLTRVTAGLPASVEVLAKAEWFNPSGSIKDRPALNILRQALQCGALKPSRGQRLLDSTSGNMGIGYATFGAARGIGVTLTVPGNASPERLTTLRALGAEVILTDPLEGSDGAIKAARRLAKENPDRYYYANQYDNPANWQAHYATTGREILAQTDGRVTHLVAGLGTSGTCIGTGRRLKEYNPAIRLVAVQPDAPFHGLEGLKHMATAIQPGIYDETIADLTVAMSTETAYEMTLRLAREEGLFVGVSAGAAVAAALQVARTLTEGVVVAILPDSGSKYLSENIWK